MNRRFEEYEARTQALVRLLAAGAWPQSEQRLNEGVYTVGELP
jgi:hypothetical protein